MSKRKKLRQLFYQYPDWSYRQYADKLGQSVDSVRAALSAMGLSRKSYTKPEPKKPKMNLPKKPEPRKSTVASKATPTRSGYIKLL
jgi:hypothetical protein